MLMTPATPEMVREWKKIHRQFKDKLKPNRKSGQEIVDYLLAKYSLTPINDSKAKQVISLNVLENEPLREKLPKGAEPNPVAFFLENEGEGLNIYQNQDEMFRGSKIFIGVDLSSGYFMVEGGSMLWDELCAFQGLDSKDIKNYYCVAQYISCLKRFNKYSPPGSFRFYTICIRLIEEANR